MRVVVSSVGRFHHFDLAAQLHKRGCLERLYTGYPRFKVDCVPHELVNSFPYVISVEMALWRFGFNRIAEALSRSAHETLDRWVAVNLRPCDVLVCNHGNGLCSYQRARQYGASVVCDCGQPHIEFIRETLGEEFRRWGFTFRDYDARSLDRRLCEYEEADLITIPSTICYRTFLERGVPQSKLAKIPYGVAPSIFNPVQKEDKDFRALFVGTLELRKGLPYLLQAFAGLNLPKFELVLIGGMSPEAKSILAKYGSTVRYRYLGFLPRTELYHYYSQGSVFVIPSIIEGLALVIPQAMACGLPVVATTNTGAEDLFTDGVEGYIVPPRDPMALREKILYLYENPVARDEMAAASLERARALWGWDNYGEGVTKAYSSLRQS